MEGRFGLGSGVLFALLCAFSRAEAPPGTGARPGDPPPLAEPGVPPTGKGDPLLDKAWHLGALGVHEAWRVTKGNRASVLAFVDSGIDYTHPDLAPNLWWNAVEWPPNGQDKDKNGYPDDVIGFDFSKNHYLPWDGGGHGTFLAGLAAAVEDNGVGSVGVCPRCSLMTLKFINSEGFGDTEDAIKGIEYAVHRGVSVINVSFSGEGYDKHLHDALKAALARDIVVVAAASNDGLDLDKEDIYPAKFDMPNLITVTATDKQDKLWRYANWGKRSVHVAAPAVDVVSIWKEHPSGYDTGSGTSDAAAIVTGVVGLVRAANPGLSAIQVVELLDHTVRLVPGLEKKTRSGGVVDAGAAVRCAVQKGLPCLSESVRKERVTSAGAASRPSGRGSASPEE